MLQPRQLEDIAIRYPRQIAELRSFLTQAGLPTGTAQALARVASRLKSDPAFRRDLSSYVWVLLDPEEAGFSVPDLLGTLAFAASGVEFAPAASEDDVHVLLRFLMETRRAFGRDSGETPVTAIAPSPPARTPAAPSPGIDPGAIPPRVETALRASAPPLSPTAPRSDAVLHPVPAPRPDLPLRSASAPQVRDDAFDAALRALAPKPVFYDTEPEVAASPTRRRIGLVLAVAFFVLALPAGYWMEQRLSSGSSHASAPSTDTTLEGLPPDAAPDAGHLVAPVGDTIPMGASTGRGVRTIPRRGSAQPSAMLPRRPEAVTAAMPPTVPAPTPAPASSPAPRGAIASALSALRSAFSSASPPPVAPAGETRAAAPVVRMPASAAIPTAVLSERIGAPSVPADAYTDTSILDDRKQPRLLRRPGVSPGSDATLLAKAEPADLPTGSRAAATRQTSAPAGTVRPTSVGVMAGNILYSPAPTYPAAASAAHVQGQVKVQAEVDRDGNVVGARVISGPPLLRDAAVAAVQQWRYKPYRSGGKPMPMSDVAVMEFELQ